MAELDGLLSELDELNACRELLTVLQLVISAEARLLHRFTKAGYMPADVVEEQRQHLADACEAFERAQDVYDWGSDLWCQQRAERARSNGR